MPLLKKKKKSDTTSTKPPPQPASTSQTQNLDLRPQRSRAESVLVLRSTADELIDLCPRFRILLLGKSGAGKSSLINAVFKVNDLADVAHDRAGVCDINREITSPSNPRFVLHDSQGFATGEVENFKIVKNFIEQRNRQLDIRHRVHAIWFCVEIPTMGGSLLETGDENILQLPLNGVPLFVVFTKWDNLEAELEMEDTDVDLEVEAEVAFDERCIQPLKSAVEDIPLYVRVSNDPRHQDTLDALVRLTQKHVVDDVALIWSIAQRASADVSIDASIKVGEKKYWRGLASGLSFPEVTLEKCLNTIHHDIVTVWNFNDPFKYLASKEFRALMSHLTEDLAEPKSPQVTQGISVTAIGTVAAVVSGVVPPAAPVAMPIAAGLFFAHWVYTVYRKTPGVLRLLMGYIVDVTIVMQSLFWLMQAKGGTVTVTRRLIKVAYSACKDSLDIRQVHNEISEYVEKTNVFSPGQKDRALNKVVELINGHRFDPTEDYKSQIRGGRRSEDDEPWA